MNILFVLYGDFSSNSVNPLALYARHLRAHGYDCAVAVPDGLDSIRHYPDPPFRPVLYDAVLSDPGSAFADKRSADVIHAWTPREVVRRFVTRYMTTWPAPLVVYLEDHEQWIARRMLDIDEETLARRTDRQIAGQVPDALAHPFRYDHFIGLADAAAVIQDKLRSEVPPWVACETVMPPVDLAFFSPRPADPALRTHYGVAEGERIIVYPGGLNAITREPIKTLVTAVGLINAQGVRCRLLRTGPFALDFIDQLPTEFARTVTDLGLIERHAMPGLLALADVFVQPGSIDPFEDLRLPGKLPELLAMGRPVIVPEANIAHLFTDGVDAVFTRTGAAEEIAARCLELLSDPPRADAIGKAGRRFAEKHFDAAAQSERMARVHETARENFDPAIAAAIWSPDADGLPVATLLVRKLTLLARSRNRTFHFGIHDLLAEHARCIDRTQSRLRGLEARIADSEADFDALSRVVDRLDSVVAAPDIRPTGTPPASSARDAETSDAA